MRDWRLIAACAAILASQGVYFLISGFEGPLRVKMAMSGMVVAVCLVVLLFRRHKQVEKPE